MQLTYRGVTYQHQPVQIQLPMKTQTGKYRGSIFYISPAVQIFRQALVAFKYRGVDYTKQVNCPQSQSTLGNTIAVQ